MTANCSAQAASRSRIAKLGLNDLFRDFILVFMTDVTQILLHIDQGDSSAAERLLPLVYDELRQLAEAKLTNEKPGQTLQATALVHEAYMRITDSRQEPWQNRKHFVAAAAEAMRRILIERARDRM